ncbi:MAG: deoxyribodipyrimidine photo-lyase [Chthoniobacter sp.]|jgi:deoxyribodipyrimidine photo-lyase|nr:deoxyribodipyrimidine photo-lyase [Chthoniobacter sp.]
MSIAIHWFRRDLRLTDNTSLSAALAQHDQVIPVYIVSEWTKEHRWTGAPRQEFLCGCLESLARNLATKGGRLIVRHGRADEVLAGLVRETQAEAIHFNRDPDPFGRDMEQKIAARAKGLGIAVHAHQDVALHERDEVLTGNGTPFKVFTPYAKAWLKLEKPTPGRRIASLSTPPKIASDPLPTLATWGLTSDAAIIEPGEAAARRRLSRFLDGPVFRYADTRNLPALDATSRLSQDLRYGTLSIREVHARCLAAMEKKPATARRSVEVFVNELIWRDFYMQVLWHWPDVLEREFQEDYRGMPWHTAGEAFKRWCAGQTGFPIVDAGMRQLRATGFMHNRMRMITAMFLTKDLHLDWRAGERWFMQRLTDGEIASNNGGWQWSASTGTDAAPYFRIQNPWAQTKRFDPDGAYIQHWVPELRDVPAVRFCAPPEPGQRLARDYPPPMVDHAREREAALEMYRR